MSYIYIRVATSLCRDNVISGHLEKKGSQHRQERKGTSATITASAHALEVNGKKVAAVKL